MKPNHALLALLFAVTALADGPKDNAAENVRPVPPPGVAVPEADKARLTEGLTKLRVAIDEAAKAQAKNPKLADLLPDVEIYHKAVDWALRYNEVHKLPEVKSADEALAEGLKRAAALQRRQITLDAAEGPRCACLSLEN
jgi:hypothetical protein